MTDVGRLYIPAATIFPAGARPDTEPFQILHSGVSETGDIAHAVVARLTKLTGC